MQEYEVTLTSLAREDLNNVFDQIAELASLPSAYKTVDKIYQKILSLNFCPERAAKWEYLPGNLRLVHAGRYSIIYEVFNDRFVVEILRVVYSRRNLPKLRMR